MVDRKGWLRGAAEVELSKMVQSGDGFTRTRRRIGTRSGIVELEVDLEALLAILGPRALASRGRKARAQRGAIVARVVDERDTLDEGVSS